MTKYTIDLMDKKRIGRLGEDLAANFLKKIRYRIVDRNFRIIGGEIDIVAWNEKILVFVEVKTRSSAYFGTPLESITPAKIRFLIRAGQVFIIKNRLGDIPHRIDVVAVDLSEGFESPKIELVRNITS